MAEANIAIEQLVSKEPNSKTILFTVSGQLDESNIDDKAKEVYKVIDDNQGKLNFIFDFAGLDYMNSKSIGYLTDWYGKIKERNGQVVITRAKQNITDILQVVGLTQLIKIYESIDEAKQALAETQTAPVAPVAPAPAPAQTPASAPATPAPAPAVPATEQEPSKGEDTYKLNA